MVSNEVYTGAGASATLIPEADLDVSMILGTIAIAANKLGLAFKNSASGTIDRTSLSWGANATGGSDHVKNRLAVNIYQGCFANISKYASGSTSEVTLGTFVIKSNDAYSITFDRELSSTNSDRFSLKILGFGTPLFTPSVIDSKHTLLADNWLGLVNTITAPSVDAEMKQLNLALGGTRNFGFQYKGAESYGSASIDVSLNNGSWLYYALGSKTFTATQDSSNTLANSASNGSVYFDNTNKTFHRREEGTICPPKTFGTADSSLLKWNSAKVDYTFTEAEGATLPSFALEFTNEKGNVTDANYFQDANDERLFSRIFTGCQVNTFTMNFEEGQELKATIDAVTRRGYDSNENYTPKRRVRTASSLFNHNLSADNLPFMFSDGTVQAFGQNLARVKSGTLTINNNITPQRYIGDYDRSIVSAHQPAQRTYEVSLNLQVTDRLIFDELRGADEVTLGDIVLTFDKNSTADTDKITITLKDYIVQSVDIPFPDDKGMIDVAVTLSARTLHECKYHGKWIIIG
tara:strand:+ start:526 stop:2085 length:1560 start_codon:yes stop_codon:yes gene_type:complete